jgi:signal peptidase I
MSVFKATTETAVARRSAVHSLVGCAIVLLVIDTWLVQGLVMPLSVASGSMAPVLRGPRLHWVCQKCGQSFACGLESLPPAERDAVCPFCRAPNDVVLGAARPGDRLLIDRVSYTLRSPRRFEIVATRSPRDGKILCVKRVVGLPGENVRIVNGDVWADGQIVRKGPTELREMATPVYRTPARGNRPTVADRWYSDTGGWKFDDGVFSHVPSSAIDWLVYRHAPPAAANRTIVDAAITDESPYDQSESRALHPVSDVMLRCQLTGGSGELLIRAESGEDLFMLRLNLDHRQATLEHNARRIANGNAGSLALDKPTNLEWTVADHEVRFALGDHAILRYSYSPRRARGDSPSTTIAIGARGSEIELRELEVLRDIYYTAQENNTAFERVLGPDEYLLLGDNSAHSEDGRTWFASGGVPARFIVGRALHW